MTNWGPITSMGRALLAAVVVTLGAGGCGGGGPEGGQSVAPDPEEFHAENQQTEDAIRAARQKGGGPN